MMNGGIQAFHQQDVVVSYSCIGEEALPVGPDRAGIISASAAWLGFLKL